jgi:membrane protein DedA with SNARE-associated domain
LPNAVPPRVHAGIIALTAALTLAGVVGSALSPYLLVKSPLLLVAISAAAHHVALAAATVDPVPLIAVATLRRLLTGVCAYGLGYVYGRVAFEWLAERYPRLNRLLKWVERLFGRWGIALLVVAPAQTLVVLAGAAQSPLLPFLIALTLGLTLWSGITYYVGDAFSHVTDLLVAFLGEHLLESTLVCVLLVALQQGVGRFVRRSARALPAGED